MDDAIDKFQIPNFRFQNDYFLHLKGDIVEPLFQFLKNLYFSLNKLKRL